MLFDLKGRRRRVVQGTYLMLAILMGGGLVLFGIGGEVSGGLIDGLTGGAGGGGNGNPAVERRIERSEQRLQANPRDEAALRELTRARFQLAGQESDPETGAYNEKGKADLRRAGEAWTRYLEVARRPDPSLARVMVQAFGEFGLNRPGEAARAAEIVTERDPTAASYLTLARYAKLAGQERKADLAGQRAVDLAPRDERKAVREQLEQLDQAAAAQAAQRGGGAGSGGSAP